VVGKAVARRANATAMSSFLTMMMMMMMMLLLFEAMD
jgi:hypothetical protein